MFRIAHGEQIKHPIDYDVLDNLFDAISDSVGQAETKYPNWPTNLLIAHNIVAEELGEAIQALNNYAEGKGTLEQCKMEYIQCAAMCVRQLGALMKMEDK